jgi:hypothetical protein
VNPDAPREVPGGVEGGAGDPEAAWHRLDTRLLLFAFAAGAALSLAAHAVIRPAVDEERGIDVWFAADIPRVFDDMTHARGSYRTPIHPLFGVVTAPLVRLLELAHVPAPAAVAVLLALTAGAWAAGLFALFRLLRLPRGSAVLLTCLGLSSSTFLFWFGVPETFAFGSLSILACLLAAAAATLDGRTKERVLGAACAASFAFTVTNVTAGLAAAFTSAPFARAARVVAVSLALCIALVYAQRRLFHTPIRPDLPAEAKFLHPERAPQAAVAILLHTFVVPEVRVEPQDSRGGVRSDTGLSVRDAPLAGALGVIGAAAWVGLLLLGAGGLRRAPLPAPFKRTLVVVLLTQVGLHLVYGTDETFLYSGHLFVGLICLAACGALGPRRRLFTALALAAIAAGGLNNAQGLVGAAAHYHAIIARLPASH